MWRNGNGGAFSDDELEAWNGGSYREFMGVTQTDIPIRGGDRD